MLRLARSLLKRDGDWYTGYKVHIADVRIQLIIIQSKLAETEVDVGVGITRVQDGWLHECWTRVEQEGKLAVNDPYPATSNLRYLLDSVSTACALRNALTVTAVVLPGVPSEMAQSSARGDPIEGGLSGK